MTAEEIRKWGKSTKEFTGASAPQDLQALQVMATLELAAQVADLRELIARIDDNVIGVGSLNVRKVD